MKRLHLICNAHLDPIWQWGWDEGMSAALATFKSAAELAEEFDYVFCHGEALLYEAIEKNAPELFNRIQRLVKAGKWHISGGWYLQPDCLMPSGESFVRQIAVGQKYFRERFGVVPNVATNYDSFGHSVGLVQIMAKNGYKGYLACRPRAGEQFEYPSRFFKWIAPDGSSVVASVSFSYGSALGEATQKIYREVYGGTAGMLGSEAKEAKKGSEEEIDYVLWGVGNHGGGPSRKDLREIAALDFDGIEILHSTPEALFSDEICVGGEVRRSLITCNPGCYSSMARVKQAYRRTENLFYATEKMLVAASLQGFKTSLQELREAEKKLLLASFHDILPGSCVEEGESEGLGLLAACERSLKAYRTNAFLHLVINQPCAGEGEFPIFVFNYFPYTVKTPVEAEFTLADQNWREDICFKPFVYDENGNELPCQQIKEASTLNLDWRKRIVFEGELKPLGITRFTVKVRKQEVERNNSFERVLQSVAEDDERLRIPASLEIYDDTADPWGMSAEELKEMGKNPQPFRLMTAKEAGEYCQSGGELAPVRIVEDGELFTCVEGLYTAGNTNAAIQYRIYNNQPYADVRVIVEFADKNKLVRLKLPVPSGFEKGKPVGDGPFVWEEKPSSGEICFQKWVGVEREDGEIFAIANDGLYGGTVKDGFIRLTLLRGAGYCFHPIEDRALYPKNRYLPRIDCGRYTYNFRIYKGNAQKVHTLAEGLNCPPYAVNVFPTGGERTADERVRVEGEVSLAALAPREEGGCVFRLYNPNKSEKDFAVFVGEKSAKGVAGSGEVVSVVFDGGRFEILRDEMPV